MSYPAGRPSLRMISYLRLFVVPLCVSMTVACHQQSSRTAADDGVGLAKIFSGNYVDTHGQSWQVSMNYFPGVDGQHSDRFMVIKMGDSEQVQHLLETFEIETSDSNGVNFIIHEVSMDAVNVGVVSAIPAQIVNNHSELIDLSTRHVVSTDPTATTVSLNLPASMNALVTMLQSFSDPWVVAATKELSGLSANMNNLILVHGDDPELLRLKADFSKHSIPALSSLFPAMNGTSVPHLPGPTYARSASVSKSSEGQNYSEKYRLEVSDDMVRVLRKSETKYNWITIKVLNKNILNLEFTSDAGETLTADLTNADGGYKPLGDPVVSEQIRKVLAVLQSALMHYLSGPPGGSEAFKAFTAASAWIDAYMIHTGPPRILTIAQLASQGGSNEAAAAATEDTETSDTSDEQIRMHAEGQQRRGR